MELPSARRLYEHADPELLGSLFQPLRVTDVSDAMDAIGYFNIGRMDPDIRPMWDGMRFWGEAVTLRIMPAREPMWPVDDVNTAMTEWSNKVGGVETISPGAPLGHVVVTDSGGSPECAVWGSEASLRAVLGGASGIVTNGYVRDNAEIRAQRSPIAGRRRGRLTVPGRIVTHQVDVTIACGGVQVRPGDIVGADDDGVIVVPREVAVQVATQARAMLLEDVRLRAGLYAISGLPGDPTTDVEALLDYFGPVLTDDERPLLSREALIALGPRGASAKVAELLPVLLGTSKQQRRALGALLAIGREYPQCGPDVAAALGELRGDQLVWGAAFEFRAGDRPEVLAVLRHWRQGSSQGTTKMLDDVERALRRQIR